MKDCSICKGTGHIQDILSNERICFRCNGTGKYWQEEFEDELGYYYESDSIDLKEVDLNKLLAKYLGMNPDYVFHGKGIKVKIKARKGTILIEKVK